MVYPYGMNEAVDYSQAFLESEWLFLGEKAWFVKRALFFREQM